MSNCLVPGGKLTPGNSLISANGQYKLALNTSGNLTLTGPGVNWSSNTADIQIAAS